MQKLGHLIINDEKILVLARINVVGRKRDNGGVSLKIRKTGEDGHYFEDESVFFTCLFGFLFLVSGFCFILTLFIS